MNIVKKIILLKDVYSVGKKAEEKVKPVLKKAKPKIDLLRN